MNEKKEGSIAITAALLVLFSAILDPRVSAGLAVAFLVALGVYMYFKK